MKHLPYTIIFYEAPHRINSTLNDLLSVFGDRKIALCREISKKFEECIRGNITDVLKCIDNVVELTKNNTDGVLNVCLNYGGRREIVDAVNKIKEANITVTEETFGKYLYNDLPDLDFVIRTSGEERISNFMLWQISYAEFYFPKVYFPDFDEKEFDKALEIYNNRNRRFGGN